MYGDTHGYKTARLTATGNVAAGGAIKRLIALRAKGGAAAGVCEIYDDAAATAAQKLGGINCAIGTWNAMGPCPQAVSKLHVTLDANITEAIVVYEPGGAP